MNHMNYMMLDTFLDEWYEMYCVRFSVTIYTSQVSDKKIYTIEIEKRNDIVANNFPRLVIICRLRDGHIWPPNDFAYYR